MARTTYLAVKMWLRGTQWERAWKLASMITSFEPETLKLASGMHMKISVSPLFEKGVGTD